MTSDPDVSPPPVPDEVLALVAAARLLVDGAYGVRAEGEDEDFSHQAVRDEDFYRLCDALCDIEDATWSAASSPGGRVMAAPSTPAQRPAPVEIRCPTCGAVIFTRAGAVCCGVLYLVRPDVFWLDQPTVTSARPLAVRRWDGSAWRDYS